MSVIWYKVWFDLWHNKTRTLLAVLSIAAGVFSMGAIFGMTDLLLTNMDKSHQEVLPPHINIILGTLVDRETLLNLEEIPGVAGIEPYNSVSVQYKLHPNDPWRQGSIHMRWDFNDQKYELVQLREGHWPNQKGEVGIERMAAQFLGVGVGDSVIFKVDNQERVLPITSLIRHPFVPPPQFADMAFFFMNADGLERFDIPSNKFNSFFVRVTPYSSDYSKEIATAIKDKLAKQNIRVAAFMYQDPQKHWGRMFMDGFALVQEALALLCVVMSAILVFNTLSNLITQQTNQIGVLKAIGGKTHAIVGIYLVNAFIYGLMALVISLPLGAIVAYSVTKIFLNLFNIDFDQFQFSQSAVIYQILAALAAPLLAGLPPVLQGANITVRQAIASYGLGGDFHSGWFDRIIEGIGQRFLSSQYATALGNMFRHKGRLLLTQLVLVTAGSAFLMVMSLNSSIAFTLDNLFAQRRYDTMILFTNSERSVRVEPMAKSVPGVEKSELRLVQSASLFVAGQLVKEAGVGTDIEGIPAKSDFFRPLIVSGRWFGPEDGRVVVLTRDMSEKNNIQVGDIVTLNLGELGKDTWTVVGIYEPVFAGGFNSDTIYAPLESLYKATKKYNQGTMLYVRTTLHTAAAQDEITRNLKSMYESHGIRIVQSQTMAALRQTNDFQFAIVIWMMLALSIIVALVGGIALMGALSIGVIERTKEIGVLRALGARSRTILSIFLMEGVLQGLLSWLIAIPLSLLASPIMAEALGQTMFGASLNYEYNWMALGIWFGVIAVISALASIIPSRSATLISVRDSLAYA